jgi:hypothetical protein
MGDSVMVYAATWTYDAAGNITEHRVDLDGDGVAERIDQFVFDDQGRLVSSSSHPESGAEVSTSYAYDACGRMASETFEEATGYAYTLAYAYAETGRLASVMRDDAMDGQADAVTTHFWRDGTEYTSVDGDADGTIDSYSELDYDAAGRLVAQREDRDGDGRVEWAWSMPGGCED